MRGNKPTPTIDLADQLQSVIESTPEHALHLPLVIVAVRYPKAVMDTVCAPAELLSIVTDAISESRRKGTPVQIRAAIIPSKKYGVALLKYLRKARARKPKTSKTAHRSKQRKR